MKKNILKYSLVLLSVFFYCVNGYAQLGPQPDCATGGNYVIITSVTPVPGGVPDGVTPVVTEDMGSSTGWCTGLDCSLSPGDLCYYYETLPLGSGILISLLLVMSYGGVLYYRRKSART